MIDNEKIKKHFFKNKLTLIYLISLMLYTLIIFYCNGFNYSKINLILITITFIVGFIILKFSLKSEKDIHKIALLYLLIFGLIIAFTSPIFVVPDEVEHFARSDLTSEGVLFPQYTPNQGYYMNNYFWDMLYNAGLTIFNANLTHWDIWDAQAFFESAFSQNLFYGYIAQAIGILLAKILDLSVIWTLWLGRVFNLIFYSLIVYVSIRNIPKFKYELLFLACLPLAIFQAASMSVDGFIFAMAILNFSYFIRLYYSKKEFDPKDLAIFFISGLSIGLLKMPYIFILLLIFLLPKNKFKSKNYCLMLNLISLLLIGIAMIYSYKYASPELLKSGRALIMAQNNVSVSGQINYMLNNPLNATLTLIKSVGGSIYTIFIYELKLYSEKYVNGYILFNLLILIIFFIVSLLSPSKFKKKERLYMFFVFMLIYVSIFLIQFLSWSPVGGNEILGIQARYFVPILPLIPLIIGKGYCKKIKDYNHILLMCITLVLSATLILTFIGFY